MSRRQILDTGGSMEKYKIDKEKKQHDLYKYSIPFYYLYFIAKTRLICEFKENIFKEEKKDCTK